MAQKLATNSVAGQPHALADNFIDNEQQQGRGEGERKEEEEGRVGRKWETGGRASVLAVLMKRNGFVE